MDLLTAFRFIVAVGIATLLSIPPLSAQDLDDAAAAQSAMDKAMTEIGVQTKPQSAAAYDKTNAAMTVPSIRTEADRKASAAMQR